MYVIIDIINYEILYNYGLYCMLLCGYMDLCEVILIEDLKCDIDLVCEFDIIFVF